MVEQERNTIDLALAFAEWLYIKFGSNALDMARKNVESTTNPGIRSIWESIANRLEFDIIGPLENDAREYRSDN